MIYQMMKRAPFQEFLHVDSPRILPHKDEIGDGTDTDHYMEPDADASSEQLSPTNVNLRGRKYDLRHNPKPNCNDNYRYKMYKSVSLWYPEQLRIANVDFEKVQRNAYGALTNLATKLPASLLEQHRIASLSILLIFQIAEIDTLCYRISTLCILVCPTEHFRKLSRKFLKF